MKFIFTEPIFITKQKGITRQHYIEIPTNKLSGNEFEIRLRNELKGAYIAKECAEWIKEKVEFKSLKKANPV